MKKLLLADQAEIIDELEKSFFKLENSNILQIFSAEQKNGMIKSLK